MLCASLVCLICVLSGFWSGFVFCLFFFLFPLFLLSFTQLMKQNGFAFTTRARSGKALLPPSFPFRPHPSQGCRETPASRGMLRAGRAPPPRPSGAQQRVSPGHAASLRLHSHCFTSLKCHPGHGSGPAGCPGAHLRVPARRDGQGGREGCCSSLPLPGLHPGRLF